MVAYASYTTAPEAMGSGLLVFGAGAVWAASDGGWPPRGQRFVLDSAQAIGDDLWIRYRRQGLTDGVMEQLRGTTGQ